MLEDRIATWCDTVEQIEDVMVDPRNDVSHRRQDFRQEHDVVDGSVSVVSLKVSEPDNLPPHHKREADEEPEEVKRQASPMSHKLEPAVLPHQSEAFNEEISRINPEEGCFDDVRKKRHSDDTMHVFSTV